jgi:long-chain acyl-CoA synthetase
VGSIGLPIPDTECRIVDLNDGETDMPVGESGELLVKGPQVMKGILEQAGGHGRNSDGRLVAYR